MKGFLIGPDNIRFEADIVRYFQNVNDHYLIYTKNEKDANGYVLLYATKVVSDSGIKVGENITDENEWALIKSFLQKTVSENKEGRPVSIEDSNPAEIADLKINAQRPFKLSETSVELFGKNKKSFEIVQKMVEEQNTVKVPVAPEVTEFVVNETQPTVNVDTNANTEVNTNVETEATPNFDSAFNFEIPAQETVSEPVIEPSVNLDSNPVAPATENVEQPVTEPVVSVETPAVENVVNTETSVATPEPVAIENTNNFEELYKNEVEKNEALNKEIEQLLKDNADYKAKLDQIKGLLG